MTQDFAALRGSRVDSWSGVEMALRETGPQFEDPEVEFLQLLGLRASGDTPWTVGTYQHDTAWGLWLGADPAISDDVCWTGIYRWRELPELPTGVIDHVDVVVEDELVAEVSLRFGTRTLLLMAGEVHETMTGGLSYHRFDESVLAFTNPAAADRVPWVPAR